MTVVRLPLAGAVAALVLLAAPDGPGASAAPGFRDVTARSGIDFTHSNGAVGDKQYCEVMGSGGAAIDYDGDGRLDLYLVTSAGPNRLYRNEGGLRFRDVTAEAGVGDAGYGMGAVAADVDGDGDQDLFVTNFGPNAYYENRGDGTFEECAASRGLDDARWGSGAAFLDYDRDGRLDLFVTNYAKLAVPDTNVCAGDGGIRLYCAPRAYPGETDLLMRQRPDGTFESVGETAGVGTLSGRGLGVVTLDQDDDGWIDVYVANDLDPNFLYHNRGGTFEEIGMMAGVSHSEDGMLESGMGLAAGDYDRDGHMDLFVSNYSNETNTVYRNEGGGFFFDESARTGLGPPSLPWICWGTSFLDFDRDGWLDLLVVSGHTESDAARVDPTTSWEQPAFLYRNLGDGTFADVTAFAAPSLLERRPSRGAVFADFDNDGDRDVVVVNQNGPALVLECAGHEDADGWIGLELRDSSRNPDAIGASVELWSGGTRWREDVRAGDSYLSCGDRRPLFALPGGAEPDSVRITWPDGGKRTLVGLGRGRYLRIPRGGGR